MATAGSIYGVIIAAIVMFGISRPVTADSDMLQDICVADLTSGVKVNGFPCKSNVTADDFFSAGLAKPGATNNTMGALVTGANVQKIPGLNTLGVSLARIDYAPGGLNPPHTHTRATEVVFVLEGQLEVGFITTANALISKMIKTGEIFVFPIGLVHFQKNSGNSTAAVISAFNSQLPGTQSIATTLFGAMPPVSDNVLAIAFQIETEQVQMIKSKFVFQPSSPPPTLSSSAPVSPPPHSSTASSSLSPCIFVQILTIAIIIIATTLQDHYLTTAS